MTVPDSTSTLGEARNYLLARLEAGVKCPCCTQMAKEYRRPLNAGMALSLLRMYQAGKTDYVNVTTVCIGGSREEGKLRFWDLVQESDEVRPDGGKAGWWRVTAKGEAFVMGDIRVRSHARVFDNTFLGFEGSMVTIDDCLGRKFDLGELMALRHGDVA